ncbi:right-handed parallel beta-helix repeat-containing protein [Tautonia sociabilis]|uniref:Right-handed parallel beta-helix repeat-containing protein n=1 Tax=Tautonia sociabilis TaxID=2080755 RepID=A0A432MCP6_9BACT|nr:right-handed parallel beta-helix repeat-containing protein [Tautonia sociabilis]RUL82162.1 right-handed parallel beta-helix repeat-containing protein [Tautonia sociabilis]
MNGTSVLILLAVVGSIPADDRTTTVSDSAGLRAALESAGPGTTVALAPGDYQGGLSIRGLRGEPGRPIVLAAADRERPPVIRGGGSGLHLIGPAHVELRDLVFEGASGNGLNIDDGGSITSPAHHISLRRLVVRDVGPEGNRDGIKLSGVDTFLVEGCTVERWGSGGSGIDMVGCHEGTIEGCIFREGGARGGNGVQAKGGSSGVIVRRCRFEDAGDRALNLGGSTGRPYFRPADPGFEAKDLTVEDCVVIGSTAGVAFVGVDGAVVRHCTFYRPRRFALRILQESTGPDFVPCRGGRFTDNIIAYRSDELALPVNIGPGTAPETFELARNVWSCLDDPGHRPRLALPERDGRPGIDPRFPDPEAGDLTLPPDSPARPAGPRDPSTS